MYQAASPGLKFCLSNQARQCSRVKSKPTNHRYSNRKGRLKLSFQTTFLCVKPLLGNNFALGALFVDAAVDVPLLGDGQEVVNYPVQYQAGREEEEHG